MLVSQNELLKQVAQIVDDNVESIILCSAFLKLGILQEMEGILEGKEVRIYVRWQLYDFISGASQIEIYDFCKKKGWTLYRNPQVHAKFLLTDTFKLLLGSSNYTPSGTGRGFNNIEWNNLIVISKSEAQTLKNSLLMSQKVDDALVQQINKTLESYKSYFELFKTLKKTISLANQAAKDQCYFLFDELPPFLPGIENIDLEKPTHMDFLRKHGIYSLDSLNLLKEFVLNNPISNIVFSLFDEGKVIVRWGDVQQRIKFDEKLYSMVENNNHALKRELGKDNRLFNLFNWIEHFDDRFTVWNRTGYLRDPREGTCSINKSNKSSG